MKICSIHFRGSLLVVKTWNFVCFQPQSKGWWSSCFRSAFQLDLHHSSSVVLSVVTMLQLTDGKINKLGHICPETYKFVRCSAIFWHLLYSCFYKIKWHSQCRAYTFDSRKILFLWHIQLPFIQCCFGACLVSYLFFSHGRLLKSTILALQYDITSTGRNSNHSMSL